MAHRSPAHPTEYARVAHKSQSHLSPTQYSAVPNGRDRDILGPKERFLYQLPTPNPQLTPTPTPLVFLLRNHMPPSPPPNSHPLAQQTSVRG